MVYPCDWEVRERNLKADNDSKQSKLLYWQRLRLARNEYANETNNRSAVFETDGFSQWMNNKYGIQLEFVDGGISGAYTVTDEKKLMMFLLKYPG